MKPYKAKTAAEALKLQALMHTHGAWCEIGLDHRTLTFANVKTWQNVKKKYEQMQEIRRLSESKSMMEEEGGLF
jgi:hypothetical protein